MATETTAPVTTSPGQAGNKDPCEFTRNPELEQQAMESMGCSAEDVKRYLLSDLEDIVKGDDASYRMLLDKMPQIEALVEELTATRRQTAQSQQLCAQVQDHGVFSEEELRSNQFGLDMASMEKEHDILGRLESLLQKREEQIKRLRAAGALTPQGEHLIAQNQLRIRNSIENACAHANASEPRE